MHRFNFFCMALIVLVMALNGCSSSDPAATPPSSDQGFDTRTEKIDDGGHDQADHDHDSEVEASDMDKMKAELAKLPESDRLSAEKQHMCPVSGEMLGTMGAPHKVNVNDQDVWICCEGCKDRLLESPNEYLAKLAK